MKTYYAYDLFELDDSAAKPVHLAVDVCLLREKVRKLLFMVDNSTEVATWFRCVEELRKCELGLDTL